MLSPFPLLSVSFPPSNMTTSLRSRSVAAYLSSPTEGASTTFSGRSAPPHTAPAGWNAATVLASASAARRRTRGASTPLLLRSYSLRVTPSTHLLYSAERPS